VTSCKILMNCTVCIFNVIYYCSRSFSEKKHGIGIMGILLTALKTDSLLKTLFYLFKESFFGVNIPMMQLVLLFIIIVAGCMHSVVLHLSAVSFDNYMQHDAHEFLNYLLNTIADLLQGNGCFC